MSPWASIPLTELLRAMTSLFDAAEVTFSGLLGAPAAGRPPHGMVLKILLGPIVVSFLVLSFLFTMLFAKSVSVLVNCCGLLWISSEVRRDMLNKVSVPLAVNSHLPLVFLGTLMVSFFEFK